LSIFRSNVRDENEGADKAENSSKLKKLGEEETELKALAADFARKVPEYEFSPAEIQLFLVGYRKSPAMAVQDVQEWVFRTREEKGHLNRDPWASEGFHSDNDISSSDKSTASAATEDGAQAREMASAIAPVETPVTTADSHCCSCQVLDDIMAIGRAEAMPSVNYPLPAGKSGLVNCVQVEQSLLFNHLSDLDAYRGTHVDRAHSVGLLNMLLDFVKKTYTSSAERHSTLSAASSSSPSLPLPASDDLLTLSQPAAKIVDLESKLAEAHCPRDTAVSNLQKFWDEEGWEPIVFEFDNATPNLSYYLHPLDYSDAAFSEMSPDDASSGTSFESGSEMSCEVDGIVEQTEAAEESLGLETNCQLCRHPATPPASPDTSTPVVQSGNQENEMPLSSGLARALENIAHLDAALIRAGRADIKIELPFADKDVTARLFCMVFKQSNDDNDSEIVERLANEFADKVPEGEFSPAEVQSFLVENMASSRMAVENVEHWMIRAREEKAKRADGARKTEILADPIKEQQSRHMPASTETIHAALPSPSYTPTLPDGSVNEQQLVTMDQVKAQIKNALQDEMLFGVLGPRPLWSFLDDPDPNPDVACYLEKLLVAAVEKLWAAMPAANTPPPSESGELTRESNQPEFWRGGGNVMRPRFLDVLTAVEISAYSNDACSETTSDEASSGTSFEGESEPSLETEASVMEHTEMNC
jgi:hypothetical protein